jgi:MerR family transcriptional regulator, thiopeptide resistance regulator
MTRTFTVSRLARRFGLSRSTLLYYDRIGLLPPSGRSLSGYRCYSERDAERLSRICTFRDAGLALGEIGLMLTESEVPGRRVLESRLEQIAADIRDLRTKQQLLCAMLRNLSGGRVPEMVNKDMWVEMLRAAGMDEKAMEHWHSEFERRAPEAHHDFLLSLGIPAPEIRLIRKWASQGKV